MQKELIRKNHCQNDLNYVIFLPNPLTKTGKRYFRGHKMNRSLQERSFKHASYSLLMIFTLLWLTVSTPFVYKADQVQKKQLQQSNQQTQTGNPFANTTEEKNENSVNTLSEYLHETHCINNDFITVTRLYNRYPSIIFPEHHPELLSPPPEA